MNLKSNFLQEFIARGYYSNCTNLDELDNLMSSQKISAYIGFDCTAKALHVGSLMQIMIIRLLQKHQHFPIILLGGGTTKIGDPSGKDESRQMLNEEIINNNFNGIKKNLEKFINFNHEKSLLLNNNLWLNNLNYIDFLRDIGKYFSINRMLSFDSVKLRLDREQNLSFIEFNYMILQAYDFYYLNKNHNCALQIGGSDQWGNIVNGVELIRKINSSISHDEKINNSFGLTTPLLTTADGKKMGKTADGAIWLDEILLNTYDYFQYFRNCHDDDVIKFLKLFTELDLDQIKKFENLQGKDLNIVKEILAFETTKICHGEKVANDVLEKARQIFIKKNVNSYEEKIININNIDNLKITDLLVEIKFCESKSVAKRLIEGKGIKINDNIIEDINFSVPTNQSFNLSIGKKNFFKITFK